MQRIPLGPFDLHDVVGHGGMGDVFRGIHRQQSVQVAVKVITAVHAQQPEFLEAFRREVQAVARLNHPGIVMVLDYGEVSAEAAEASNGMLVAKSPYLVMEYARRGTLKQLPKPFRWSDLEKALFSLLDALAHSHARDVVHLDLKMGNVLISGPEDARPGFKLTDFGIAHALDESRTTADGMVPMGTLLYMSPEQIRGDWRDFGPWTDLYSLGCLAYRLATGRPPFKVRAPLQLAEAHLSQAPDRFSISYDLPVGFESWLVRLLQKDPQDRFQCAADATNALRELGDVRDDSDRSQGRSALPEGLFGPKDESEMTLPTPSSGLARWSEPTALDATLRLGPDGHHVAVAGEAARREETEHPCPIPSVQVPPSWDRPSPPSPSIQLVGAGLGLYGLREVPLVDRNFERDVLWSELTRVHTTRRAQLVLLRGAAGFGKSRLAEWLCRRAHEVGSALIFKAVHGPIPGPTDGLAWMLSRFFRCIGLTRPRVLTRLEGVLGAVGIHEEHEWHALAEMIRPATPLDIKAGARPVRFSGPRERYCRLCRILERIAFRRPIILWLDDVQWGTDALDFAEYVIDERERLHLPILLVLTARDEALAERPLESEQLTRLLEKVHTQSMVIGPLGQADRSELVKELLALEEELANRVERRTDGNPLFTVQLIGDWVRRGVLEVGGTGFALKRGEKAVLPDDIHAVWVARRDRLLMEFRSEDRLQIQIVLELAAALGTEVEREEWRSVCLLSSLSYPTDLPALLVRSQLAVPTESGWSFVHGMLSESLVRMAKEAQRWKGHNETCAAMLEQLYPSGQRGIAARLGMHWLRAEQFESALGPLLEGARDHLLHNEFRQSLYLLEVYQRALDQFGAAKDDPRRAQGWLLQSRNLLAQTDLDSALELVENSAKLATRVGSQSVLAEALRLKAWNLRYRGQYAKAIELDLRALEMFRHLDDQRGIVKSLYNLGLTRRCMGDLDQARAYFEQSLIRSEEEQNYDNWSQCLRGLAQVALEWQQFDEALRMTRQALDYYLAEGDRFGEAECFNGLGEIQRFQGDLDGAELSYRKAADLFDALGTVGESIVLSANLSSILLEKRQFEEARRRLESLEKECETRDLERIATVVDCLLLVPLAAQSDWPSWDARIERASASLARTGLAERDVAWALQQAGKLALQSSNPRRARRAYELAGELWMKLGVESNAAEIRAVLNRLP